MINKKNITQKGFRIDSKLVKQLDILSNVTGRSQNDLATMAFQKLLVDNSLYFIENTVLELVKNESKRGLICIAGLAFCKIDKMLMFYSKYKYQHEDPYSLEYLNSEVYNKSTPKSKEEIRCLKIKLEAEGYKYFYLIDLSEDEDRVLNEIHESMMCIDTNFKEMNNWINDEFNYD